jgi:hypothetical protein
MPVVIDGSNTPTAGGVVYGDGTEYASTSAGTSGQVLLSNGSSAPTWGTAGTSTTATNLAGGSAGTVPYQSASGTTAMLAAGTSGQVLTSSGAGAPSWTTPNAGALVFLATTSGTNFTSLSLDYNMDSTYDMYMVIGTNFAFNDFYSEIPYMRMKLNGSYATSGYTGLDATTDRAALTNSALAATSPSNSYDFVWWIPTPSNTNYRGRVIYTQYMVSDNGGAGQYFQGVIRNSASAGSNALTGVQILRTNYNYQTGTMALYGYKKS